MKAREYLQGHLVISKLFKGYNSYKKLEPTRDQCHES